MFFGLSSSLANYQGYIYKLCTKKAQYLYDKILEQNSDLYQDVWSVTYRSCIINSQTASKPQSICQSEKGSVS